MEVNLLSSNSSWNPVTYINNEFGCSVYITSISSFFPCSFFTYVFPLHYLSTSSRLIVPCPHLKLVLKTTLIAYICLVIKVIVVKLHRLPDLHGSRNPQKVQEEYDGGKLLIMAFVSLVSEGELEVPGVSLEARNAAEEASETLAKQSLDGITTVQL
jgi:hypothetical protein